MNESNRVELLISYLSALAEVSRSSNVKVFSEIQRTIDAIESELKKGSE